MTTELLDKLVEYIDAAIETGFARSTSDGGLTESVRADKVKEELYVLLARKPIPTTDDRRPTKK